MPLFLVPNSNGEDNAPLLARIREFNQCHNPPGSPDGGKFCSGPTVGHLVQHGVTHTPIRPETLDRLHAIGHDESIPETDRPAEQLNELLRSQPEIVREAQALIDRGHNGFKEFNDGLTAIAQRLDFSLHTNIESREILERDVDWVVVGPVKGLKRTATKAALDYDGDVSKVKDVLRGTIAVRDAPGMVRALEQLTSMAEIVNIKDHVSKPLESGYRDLNVLVRMPKSGMLAEMQIIAKPVLEAKMTRGHRMYEAMRGMRASSHRYQSLLREQVELYSSAWARVAGHATVAFSLAALLTKIRGGA